MQVLPPPSAALPPTPPLSSVIVPVSNESGQAGGGGGGLPPSSTSVLTPTIIATTSPKVPRLRRSPTKPQTPHSGSGSGSGSASGSSTSSSAHARVKPKLSSFASASASGPGGSPADSPKATTPRKQKATFTTCRSYPDHSYSLYSLPTSAIPAGQQQHEEEEQGELKRNQRRSKQEALARMDKTEQQTSGLHSTSVSGTSFLPAPLAHASTSSAQATAGPSISRNPLYRPRIVNPPFDIRTVRTEAPRFPEPRTEPRLFGLQECPVFYPSPEEFRDPMAYIDSIGHLAKPFGICKIIPPEGWRMPFSLETDTFRFKTRLQKLNSLEAASRAKINFLEQIALYHSQQGDPDVSIPFIERTPVDLWRLRKEVTKAGGYDETCRTHAWSTVAIVMGFEANHGTDLERHYRKIIRPFENFAVRAKSMSGSPLTPLSSAGRRGPVSGNGNGNGNGNSGIPGHSPETPSRGRMGGMRSTPRDRTRTSDRNNISPSGASLSLPREEPSFLAKIEEAPRATSASASIPFPTPIPTIKIKVPGFIASDGSESELSEEEPPAEKKPLLQASEVYEKGEVCEVCRGGHHEKMILLCDGCDRGFHTYCLDPPLDHVPDNEEWYCTSCLLGTGEDFGFDEGEEHSIPSFQARDSAFAAAWFNAHRPPVPREPDDLSRRLGRNTVAEDDVEREFWRLINSSEETVEVEYGADVHSTTHGSGAPTLETHPENPYAADPWNLNNMPILPESLLRYIKSDISGMTVPWIYLGMLFSTFCWHNEDHYTYSVNYMYWGETKTWYGIPGSDAHKFEEAIQSEAPELFEQQPTLLYDLVTMMNPGKLSEKGVKVVACDQRPNEFVITFPKAYHCGFNHGINFNEAVNFALPDWLAEGKECVQRYKQHSKVPVFSHDELLVTITLYSDTIRTALWLKDSLTEMVKEESASREKIRNQIPMLHETLVEEDCPEDQYQCCICKGFSYLSQMTCTCTKAIACLDHASQLCACSPGNRTLRMRYSENQLEEILHEVTTRAALPTQWRERFDNLLEAPKPPLKSLRGLLAEGEKIDYPMPEISDLRAFVERSNAWVERVASLATRKPTGRRRNKGRQDDVEDELDRSPEALARLMEEANLLAFESEEIRYLAHVLSSISSFRDDAIQLLSIPEDELSLEKCKSVLIVGDSLNVDLPEIAQLSAVVNRLTWFHKVEEEVDDETLQIGEIVALLKDAVECSIPIDHPTVVELKKREAKGLTWKSEVEKLLRSQEITIDEISTLIDNQEYTPISVDLMRQLENVRKTALNWQTSATSILTSGGSAIAATRLCKAVRSSSGALRHIDIPEIDQLQSELDQYTKWLTDLASILMVNGPNKVVEELKRILLEFQYHLNPLDDKPASSTITNLDSSAEAHSSFSCFCRRAQEGSIADGKMIQCSVCEELYHVRCVGKIPKGQTFSCEMCAKPELEDYRPSIDTLATFADPTKWRWRITSPETGLIGDILVRAQRYSIVILPIMNPFEEVQPCHDPKLIEHHLRKLYNIPLRLDLRWKNQLFIAEDWLDARLDQALKYIEDLKNNDTVGGGRPEQKRRRRKGIFEVGNARPGYFYCVCEDPKVPGLHNVVCQRCKQSYHYQCLGALAPLMLPNSETGKALRDCPCCCVKQGWQFPISSATDTRIGLQMLADLGTKTYVDYKYTLQNYLNEPLTITIDRFEGRLIPLVCTRYTLPREMGPSNSNSNPNPNPKPKVDVVALDTSGSTTINHKVHGPQTPSSLPSHVSDGDSSHRPDSKKRKLPTENGNGLTSQSHASGAVLDEPELRTLPSGSVHGSSAGVTSAHRPISGVTVNGNGTTAPSSIHRSHDVVSAHNPRVSFSPSSLDGLDIDFNDTKLNNDIARDMAYLAELTRLHNLSAPLSFSTSSSTSSSNPMRSSVPTINPATASPMKGTTSAAQVPHLTPPRSGTGTGTGARPDLTHESRRSSSGSRNEPIVVDDDDDINDGRDGGKVAGGDDPDIIMFVPSTVPS